MAMIKMYGEAVLLTIIAGIGIGTIGYLNQWDTSLKYSNAFFIAGCLAIIAGTSSRLTELAPRSMRVSMDDLSES